MKRRWFLDQQKHKTNQINESLFTITVKYGTLIPQSTNQKLRFNKASKVGVRKNKTTKFTPHPNQPIRPPF